MLNSTHSLTHSILRVWAGGVYRHFKHGFQLAYIDAYMWTYGSMYVDVRHRKSTQDTADANYVTVVVSGHNCVVIHRYTTTQYVKLQLKRDVACVKVEAYVGSCVASINLVYNLAFIALRA